MMNKFAAAAVGLTLPVALFGCTPQPAPEKKSEAQPAAAQAAKPAASPPSAPANQTAFKPDTLILNGDVLFTVRQKVISGDDSEYKAAIVKLKSDANAAMNVAPLTVTSKTSVPPSGDKHDYMSMGPYWWPDPSKPDGKPYIQKDGQTNPERDTNKYDAVSFGKMKSTVETLALGYYVTGEEKYAEHAAKLLRAWFLDPATKMNPNMNYGQSVPGRYDGRKEGVLDSRHFLDTSDAVRLLKGSKSWSDEDTKAYQAWIAEYVKWLKTNKLALDEKKTDNNHSTWYDAILVGLMLFSGDKDGAVSYMKDQVPKRIAAQIDKDGSMPLEMKRTRSFHYPVFNLEAFSILALYGSKSGVDLWNYKTQDGRSIKGAFDYLVPYFNGKPWPLDQLKVENESEFASYLREAAVVFGDKTYAQAADKALGSAKESSRIKLTAPVPTQ